MRIGLTGASGLIGRRVAQLASERGCFVIGFSRDPRRALAGCDETREYSTNGRMDFEGCDAIIHLAGENVFGLWTPAKRKRIRQSRVLGTRSVVESIAAARERPAVLVNGSAMGFYGSSGEEPVDEKSGHGRGFLANVVREWEAEAWSAVESGARVVLIRTSIVLGPEGPLQLMARPFRYGLGGELGDGRQWMSWIHLDDIAELFLHALENPDVEGPLNGSSPEPCRNFELTDEIASILGRPAVFRAPAWVLRAALGGFSRELLGSRRVIPRRTRESGFVFRFPTLSEALLDGLAARR